MRSSLPASEAGSAAWAGSPASPVSTTSVVGVVNNKAPVLAVAPFGMPVRIGLGTSPSAMRMTRLSSGVLTYAYISRSCEYVGDITMSINPPSPDGSTGMTILTLGSALVETSLTAPVMRSRQPCMTPGAGQALGNGLGGSGGGGGGDDDGPGLSSGWVVNGCDCASSKRAQPDIASNAAHSRTITPRMGRRCLMQARLRIVWLCAPRSPRGAADKTSRIRAPKRRANPRFVGDYHLPWQP